MAKPTRQIIINQEDFLTKRHLDSCVKNLVDESTKDFNFERFTAKDLSGASLVDVLQTPPMMGGFRTVVVDGFESFKKPDLEALISFVKNPNPHCHVIFVGSKVDKRTGFYKAFIKVGELIEFKGLYDNKVSAFVEAEAKRMGLKLEPGCAQDMADIVGNHLMALVSELEKLKLYVHPHNAVSRTHVSELVVAGLVSNVFQLSNLLGERRLLEASTLFKRMTEQGEAVIRLISMVTNHFRKLLLLKAAGRVSSKDLASILGVHPFFVKDYQQQASKFSEGQLKEVFHKLMKLSIATRSTGLSPNHLFETFLQETCLGLKAA